jgi:hypothetical protein
LRGRPVRILFNGNMIGTLTEEGRSTKVFTLGPESFVWDDENVITVLVNEAGPLGTDKRELGYRFERVEITGGENAQ